MKQQQEYVEEEIKQNLTTSNAMLELKNQQLQITYNEKEFEAQKVRIETLEKKLMQIFRLNTEKSDEINQLNTRIQQQEEQIDKQYNQAKDYVSEIT